jgi:hypothetical protein
VINHQTNPHAFTFYFSVYSPYLLIIAANFFASTGGFNQLSYGLYIRFSLLQARFLEVTFEGYFRFKGKIETGTLDQIDGKNNGFR